MEDRKYIYTNHSNKVKIKPIHIIVIIAILFVFFLIIISLQSLFYQNPFGEELKIDNFSKYYKNVPSETRDSVFASLYNTVSLNVTAGEEVPTSGATIKDQSASEDYDETTKVYYGNFTVDVEAIQQTFKVNMQWAESANNPNLSGYTVTVTCLTGASSTYHSTSCIDMFTNDNGYKISTTYPLIYKLPIKVSEYNEDYTKYTHYTITYTVESDDKIIVHITDYTGGNYNAAIKKIKDLGFVPEQYNIKYNDQSADQIPARP